MAIKITAYGQADLKQIDRARQTLDKLEASAAKNSIGMTKSFVAIGAAAGGVAIAIDRTLSKATATAKDYGSEVIQIQRLTGESSEESSKWAAILGRFGVNGAKAALIVKTLATNIDGNSKALQTMGVATKDANGKNRTSTEVLRDVADYYAKASDKTHALALASKVLGRGYASLLPVLASGAEGIDKLAASAESAGLILSDSDVKELKDYNKALADNKMALKGVEVQVGLATLPYETFKAEAVGGTLKLLRQLNPELAEFGVVSAEVAGGLAKGTAGVAAGAAFYPALKSGIPMLTKDLAALGLGFHDVALAQQLFLNGSAGLSQLPKFTAMAVGGITSFGIAVAAAALNWVTYKAAQASAQSDFQIGTFMSGAKQAREHAAAIGSATGAQATWTSAVNQAVPVQEKSSVTTARHATRYRDAAVAARELDVATTDLTRSMSGQMVASDKASGKLRTLTELELDSKEAKLAVKDAEDRLTDARKKGSKRDVAKAEIELTRAKLRARDATADLTDKEKELGTTSKKLAKNIRESKGDIKKAAEYMAQGLADGLTAKQAEVASAARLLIEKGVKGTIVVYAKIKSPSKMTYKLGTQTGDGYALGIVNSKAKVEKAAEKVAERVKKALEKYRDQVTALKDRSTQIAGTWGLTDMPEIQPVSNNPVYAMQKQVTTLKTYAADIAKLKKAGLSKAALSEVLALGPNEGSAVAKALLASDISQYNKLYGERKRISDSLAVTELGKAKLPGSVTISAGAVQVSMKITKDMSDREIDKAVDRMTEKIARKLHIKMKK